MGSWLNYGLGSESQNLPGYVVLTAGRGTSGGASLWQSGFLPIDLSGVLFRNQGEPVLNLTNPAGPAGRAAAQRARRAGRELNAARASSRCTIPEIASRIASYELAFRMQIAAPELIDLSRRDPSDARRCTASTARSPTIKADRGGGPGQYPRVRHATACSRGGWSSAACGSSTSSTPRGIITRNLDDELPFNAGMADQPIAALIKDLKQRGLLDETLVVWAQRVRPHAAGREPRRHRESVTGRDHHPFAFTHLAWPAAASKAGQVYGETDEIGWGVVEDPVHVNDFHATMLHLFGLDHLKLTHRFQGRDFRLTDVAGKVIDPGWHSEAAQAYYFAVAACCPMQYKNLFERMKSCPWLGTIAERNSSSLSLVSLLARRRYSSFRPARRRTSRPRRSGSRPALRPPAAW